ncbi:MAG: GDSL-type esterase/lipase family protein [Chloroflexota bacterium]
MRIVFLGDSLTWGGYGGNFVAETAKRLPDHTIINAGEGGDTVVNLLRRLDTILETHEPDAMFVMVGGNDANSYAFPDTRGYYKKAKQLDGGMVTPDQFEESYRELLSQLQLNFVQPLIGLPPSEYSREAIDAKHGYNLRARKVAESLNIPILDLDAIYTPKNPIERDPISLSFIQQIGVNWSSGWDKFEEERAKWGYTYTFDGLHILPHMGEEFAKHIVPFLEEHLL